jgi:hypothetical protein
VHDTPDQVHWHEPKAGENAGLGTFKRPLMPYDRFIEVEGVPVYRGIGVRRAVHDSAQCVPPLGERRQFAGAAVVRNLGAECDEPVRQYGLHLQLPLCVRRTFFRRGGLFQAAGRAGPRCGGLRCGARTHAMAAGNGDKVLGQDYEPAVLYPPRR